MVFFAYYILWPGVGNTTHMSYIGCLNDAGTAGVPYHPQQAPRFPFSISLRRLREIFADCSDYQVRSVWPGGEEMPGVALCWLEGLVSAKNVSQDVLRPLTDAARLRPKEHGAATAERILRGAVWACSVELCSSTDALVEALLAGCCAVVFDAEASALCFEVRTDNARAISPPAVEKTVKGGKDAFVEVFRTNTALVRRRIRDPALKLKELSVGRKSHTTVGVAYLDGVANQATLAELLRRLGDVDIDALSSAGSLEQYITDRPGSPFPQLLHTERPDRFAAELLAGRIGILVDGLPMGFLLPATLASFMQVAEDRAQHFLVASGLTLLRWLSALISALFPAVLVAVSMYHQEMIPTKLLLSMIEAKQQVPFSEAVEVLAMLLAFELLMEAGIRLPDPAGDTVSIIGALIVGQSAVTARVVSPITVIVVATSAICGFTQPSRDMGAALRLVRLGMVLLAIFFGLFGIAVGIALLSWYLSTLESFGVAYTSPMAEGGLREVLYRLLQPPLRSAKLREAALHTPDRRNQK